MNRTQLTQRVAQATGMTQERCGQVVAAVFNEILIETIIFGGKVTVNGFGKFEVVQRNPRPARNPKTGEPVLIPARDLLRFTPSPVVTSEMNK